MQNMSVIRRDFLTSHLRSQLWRLKDVLGSIEEDGGVDCVYTSESLKEIEANLHNLRKLCVNN